MRKKKEDGYYVSCWSGSSSAGGDAKDFATDLHDSFARLWSLQVLTCFQLIWRWRHQHPPETTRWLPAAARAATEIFLNACVYHVQPPDDVRSALTVLRRVWDASTAMATQSPQAPPPAHPQYLLFFDGGSRGNPGPGGSGSVVVRVDSTVFDPTLVWSAATSLDAATTTNNIAEYQGLFTGLQAAERHRWVPLTVIGDSQLILRQVSQYRPSTKEHLRVLYSSTRLAADRLNVREWRHHLRVHNKMADFAANVAMDSKRNLQTFHPSDRPEWRGLQPLLQGDYLQWKASTERKAPVP